MSKIGRMASMSPEILEEFLLHEDEPTRVAGRYFASECSKHFEAFMESEAERGGKMQDLLPFLIKISANHIATLMVPNINPRVGRAAIDSGHELVVRYFSASLREFLEEFLAAMNEGKIDQLIRERNAERKAEREAKP